MIVDLMRHGSTGRDGFIDGRADWPPTDAGRAQIERQTQGRAWSSIRSSPLQRAREPAMRVAAALRLTATVDADWAELDFGQWDGRRRAEIEASPEGRAALAAFHADPVAHPPPGGEAWSGFEERIGRALARLLDDGREPALIVTHAGPIRMALSLACGFPLDRLWALRIGYGTRVRVEIGRGDDGRPWGEIVEIVQP